MKYKSTQFLYTYTVSYSTMELHPSQMVYSTQFLFVFLTQIVQISIKNIWWPFNIKVNSLDQNIDFFICAKPTCTAKSAFVSWTSVFAAASLLVFYFIFRIFECQMFTFPKRLFLPPCLFSIFLFWIFECSHFQNVYFYLHACYLFYILNIWMFTFPKCVFLRSCWFSIFYFEYLNVDIPKTCIFTSLSVFNLLS